MSCIISTFRITRFILKVKRFFTNDTLPPPPCNDDPVPCRQQKTLLKEPLRASTRTAGIQARRKESVPPLPVRGACIVKHDSLRQTQTRYASSNTNTTSIVKHKHCMCRQTQTRKPSSNTNTACVVKHKHDSHRQTQTRKPSSNTNTTAIVKHKHDMHRQTQTRQPSSNTNTACVVKHKHDSHRQTQTLHAS